MRKVVIIIGVAVLTLLVAVFGRGVFLGADDVWPADDGNAASLAVVYPADGSIFPPDFVAPTFLWRDKDSQADRWAIEIAGKQGNEPLWFYSAGDPPPPGEIDENCISDTNEIYLPPAEDGPVHSWTPDAQAWEQILRQCGERQATVAIMGFSKAQPHKAVSTGRIAVSVSTDPVGAPIFYRDVPLMPSEDERGVIKPLAKEALPLIVWRLRDVSKPTSRVVMKDMPSCANCHTFSRDGKTLGMDIDGPSGDKGAYTIAPVSDSMVIENKDLITWNSFKDKPKGHKTIGFMSQVSPDGQYVVTTVNESVYIENFSDYRFLQVFYPTRGILAYYSRRTGQMEALPGADNLEYVHCNPTWSPDGKYLVFARAKARDPYGPGHVSPKYANDPNELKMQYDLYRIPFNDGRGGEPEPIQGAAHNEMSNSFPRISPDGRWIVFVQCRNGLLMRPDSRLWIVPATGGQAREMNCNTSLMNSWHSFAPSGRWMVFSSKSNTPYTQMFLTHIDEQGQDSPPILIPNSTAANRAVNLPEFANIAYDELVNIDVPAVDWRRPFNRGVALVENNKPRQALEQFKDSLRIDPKQARTHSSLGDVLMVLGLPDEAIAHFRQALRIKPDFEVAHLNLGAALAGQGKIAEAIAHYREALRIKPNFAQAHHNLGIALQEQGKLPEAIAHYRLAVRIKPDSAQAHSILGVALAGQGKLAEATEHLRQAARIDPEDAQTHRSLALTLQGQGKIAEAIEHFRMALRIKPEFAQAHTNLAVALAGEGNVKEAIEHFRQAARITPDDKGAHRNLAIALDTLAAAHAKAGRSDEAIQTASEAIDAATTAGDQALAQTIRGRVVSYRQSGSTRTPEE